MASELSPALMALNEPCAASPVCAMHCQADDSDSRAHDTVHDKRCELRPCVSSLFHFNSFLHLSNTLPLVLHSLVPWQCFLSFVVVSSPPSFISSFSPSLHPLPRLHAGSGQYVGSVQLHHADTPPWLSPCYRHPRFRGL
jgi:hypothetical protein